MFKKFLKANRSWLIFFTAMLIVAGTAYKAQASDGKPLDPIQVEYKEVGTDSKPGEPVGFIQWAGDKYRLVITKTATGYTTLKQNFFDEVQERRIAAGIKAVGDFRLNDGETYSLERLDGSHVLATFRAPAEGTEDQLDFFTIYDTSYHYSSSGENINNGMKPLVFKGDEWSEEAMAKDRTPEPGKAQPVSAISALN